MYDLGKGVLEDTSLAVKWYRAAAEQGYAEAQWSLGEKYRQANCVSKDGARAFEFIRAAAEQGLTAAQNSIGTMYQVVPGRCRAGPCHCHVQSWSIVPDG